MPLIPEGIILSFNISTRIDGSLTFSITATVNGNKAASTTKKVKGFLKLLDYFKNLNLKPNVNFTPPQNINNYVNFPDSGPIFANFDMTIEQVKQLSSIENLYMKVSNFNLSQGSTTLELFIKISDF